MITHHLVLRTLHLGLVSAFEAVLVRRRAILPPILLNLNLVLLRLPLAFALGRDLRWLWGDPSFCLGFGVGAPNVGVDGGPVSCSQRSDKSILRSSNASTIRVETLPGEKNTTWIPKKNAAKTHTKKPEKTNTSKF